MVTIDRGIAGPLANRLSNGLAEVIDQMRAIEAGRGGFGGPASTCPMPIGLNLLDEALPGGGLRRGAVHEWFGVAEADAAQDTQQQCGGRGRWATDPHWSPPLCLLAHLAAAALSRTPEGDPSRWVVWIGARVWPYPHLLARRRDGPELLARTFLIRTPDDVTRLWAIELALRSAAGAVIADGSRLDRAATQRLQLAAESKGSLCILARPPGERTALSAATTRWWVSSSPSTRTGPRWTVQLLRCKGEQPAPGAVRPWTVEHDWATGDLGVLPHVADRSGKAADEPFRSARTG